MTYAIVYSSRTGNTKLLAEAVRNQLPQESCVYFGAPSKEALRADRIYIGFWTDRGSCNEETASFLKTVTNQEVFLFGTAGAGDPQYYDKVLERTCTYLENAVRLIGSYMCQGKMPMSIREEYVKMLNDHVQIPNLKDKIENFDKALSHPDQKDVENLKKSIEKIQ